MSSDFKNIVSSVNEVAVSKTLMPFEKSFLKTEKWIPGVSTASSGRMRVIEDSPSTLSFRVSL